MRTGNLFVISGPSGVGKGTLVARLLRDVADTWLSISATTRKPREGELDGVNYYFVNREEFDEMVANDLLLEWAEYSGNCYGTPRKSVEEQIASGKQVILEIDVQGALQVRNKMPQAHLVFIDAPSMEELEKRLVGRGTEDEQTIQRRLDAARGERAKKSEYDFVLVNDDLDEAEATLVSYVNSQANALLADEE